VSVSNVGDELGAFNMSLKINGLVEEGDGTTNSTQVSATVEAKPTPFLWPIVAIVVIAVALFLVARR